MGRRTPAAAGRLFCRILLAIAWANVGVATPARADDSLEAAVKASYLSKFAPFIVWPTASPNGAFTICVVGADPFGSVLDRAVSGRQIDGRPMAVVRLAKALPTSPCQIAFLGGLRGQDLKDALKALRGSPVLTVTDEAHDPGIVDFAISDGRIRFRLDAGAAAENGLTISSKLLSLALTVNPARGARTTR